MTRLSDAHRRFGPLVKGACRFFFLLSLAMIYPNLVSAEAPPAIDPAVCRSLVQHTPDADVTYQPGVDVEGNAVAPADLPGPAKMKLPDKLQIPLTLSLVKTLNLNTAQYPYNQLGPDTEVQLGTLDVEGDKVFYNGQPLSDTQQQNLAVLCLKSTDSAK